MKIAIAGCAGRMGRMLIREILDTQGCVLVGGSEVADSPFIGRDIVSLVAEAPSGYLITDDVASLAATADVLIDFTAPHATLIHAKICAENACAHVIGTTGLTAQQEDSLRDASTKIAVVYAPNMSVGVTLLMGLVEQAARLLDESYDIEIIEMHHRHKVDAPSGTALGLGKAAATGRGCTLDDVADKVRDGVVGPRKMGDIGFATLRGGDVVGDHTVIFAAEGERLELGHKASSRILFARGAVRAARWVSTQRPGLYSMRDVLGL